jgi:hypothetical protein
LRGQGAEGSVKEDPRDPRNRVDKGMMGGGGGKQYECSDGKDSSDGYKGRLMSECFRQMLLSHLQISFNKFPIQKFVLSV